MRVTRSFAAFLFVFLVCAAALSVFAYRPVVTQAQALTEEDKARLRAEYDQLQQEIAQWQKVLDETRAKKKTLTGDVSALDAQIKQAETQIKAKNNTIARLASDINEKTKRISGLESRLTEGRESLGKLLRQKNEADTYPLAAIALGSEGLSSFFADIDAIDSINSKLQEHFLEIRSVKAQTEGERAVLTEKRNEEADAKYEAEVKRAQIKKNETEKKQLLSLTTSAEKSYQAVLVERQKRADAIRNALFELRDSQGIPFSTALAYASSASQATGVRAAFILGILRQETNLGENVGQCYLTDAATGAGRGKNTGKVFPNLMKPDRDVPVFLDLMERLGRDPYSTVVSCPQSVGYGGAMGASQFIPSTWKGYESRLRTVLGVSQPDPWNAKDAITATALYLKDLGANKGTYSAEREAAARYYAGGNWQKSGLGYANSVLTFAQKYQDDIDFLKDN
jgi:peptidoglycan hydrolase CwlO-like protein